MPVPQLPRSAHGPPVTRPPIPAAPVGVTARPGVRLRVTCSPGARCLGLEPASLGGASL